MALDIEFARSASKEIRQLDRKSQERIFHALKALQQDPRPNGAEKLKGYPDFLRLRVGNFRVIYHIYNEVLIVVLLVRDRKDAYEAHALKALEQKLETALANNVVRLKRSPSKPD
ncbi:type II toxin-antitoxin system RelE/ParE family toxin [Alkalicaulis satelles]|uniref:Type II toxin-antitoxin system RelE/ParE family toxin n=1 Tax=Alkalicaulis satelles TaxID=2609175 RepID=A0A5M6ZGF5_9PROT|nr:type II toxin-antitoxin system RelE/ParE family toxin [Alkalicaulis satelles]KAA5803823.1 type II toxin-antitoxin system RelE/ParE family toxin [Alkalicaulis satelles]